MSAGKGDSPRPLDLAKFRENYDRIFLRPEDRREIHDKRGKVVGFVTFDQLKNAVGISIEAEDALARKYTNP